MKGSKKKRNVVIVAATIIVIAVIVIAIAVPLSNRKKSNASVDSSFVSGAQTYSKVAVAADAQVCSEIGRDILQKNGTAVDSAVATLFCIGLFNMESCGIGGGGFMNVYLKKENKSIIYDFRETAPAAANESMFLNSSSVFGGLAIGVPGNVKGLYYVWQKHGGLPWPDLVQPTIDIAKKGFTITKSAGGSIESLKEVLAKSAGFRELLMKKDGSWYKTGETLKNPQLAATLEIIRDKPHDFYNGSLAKQIVKDVQDAGGIITLEDLMNYTVAEREPLINVIKGKKYLFMPPPSSASVIAMTLNILNGYNYSAKDYTTTEQKISITHTFIEALKFAFARRPLLGDPTFEANVSNVIDAMFNQTFAEILRKKINLTSVLPNETYYGGYYSQEQMPYGTSHVSILAENGDAVAATDTINYDYGGGVRSNITGIIYNNQMDDFSTPGKANTWGYLPAKANYIKPGKRPLSSMSPTIVLDSNDDVIMVVGGSGGSRIISGTGLTLFRKMFLEMDLGSAINENRVHTHLLPNEVYVTKDYPISKEMIAGLEKLGHKMVMSELGVAVQAVYRDKAGGTISAMSDPRKGGVSSGF